MIFREAAETILHVPPGDAVKGTQLPVAEIAGKLFKVQFFGARRPVGITRHVIGEGLLEKRHAAHLGTLACRVGATSDLAQCLMGETPRLLGRHPAIAAKNDTLVGCLSATVAGAVVDEEGFDAGGMHLDAEAGQDICLRPLRKDWKRALNR